MHIRCPYSICLAYSLSRFPPQSNLPKLPSSRVALSFESSLLSTFLKGSSLAALPLRTKDVDIPYFVQNFLLALLAYMESAATHLTLTFISFLKSSSVKGMGSIASTVLYSDIPRTNVDKYNTALNKDGAKANESIWEVEFAGNRSTDVRAEGRIGNIIGIQGKDLSSKASITGKGDPGYAYAFIWNTPKLLELYEANDDIDRCNWNIAPFTYTQSAGEGTSRVVG